MPGTLLVSEATLISLRFGGRYDVPGIWSHEQVVAWKEIVDAVHANGCFIFCQLWALGRAGHPEILADSGGHKLSSASALPMHSGAAIPAEMTEQDIQNALDDYAEAAKKAIAAGFDGVEIHGANGYLPDQFLQDTSNNRSDEWGGSIENRARFHIEVTKRVIAAVGANRTAMRLSPFSDFQGMLMDEPVSQFDYLVRQLRQLGLAYLHLIEARIRGNDDAVCGGTNTVEPLIRTWDNASPVLLAGGFKPGSAAEALNTVYKDYDVCIVFGRYFVSNPDLVYRIRKNLPLEPYNRSVFYTPHLSHGYTDYTFSASFLARA